MPVLESEADPQGLLLCGTCQAISVQNAFLGGKGEYNSKLLGQVAPASLVWAFLMPNTVSLQEGWGFVWHRKVLRSFCPEGKAAH